MGNLINRTNGKQGNLDKRGRTHTVNRKIKVKRANGKESSKDKDGKRV